MVEKMCFMNEERACDRTCRAFKDDTPEPGYCQLLWLSSALAKVACSVDEFLNKPTTKTVFPKSAPPPEVR